MILLWRILFHCVIVDFAPHFFRESAEQMVFKLFHVAANKKKLMPRDKAKLGKAFLGRACCTSKGCHNEWTVFTREGCDENIRAECKKCGKKMGRLI